MLINKVITYYVLLSTTLFSIICARFIGSKYLYPLHMQVGKAVQKSSDVGGQQLFYFLKTKASD